jgi:hypothetical protein
MCVRALRMTGLKSAGNFTRGECRNLNAEKIQRVKCFVFTARGFVARRQFPNVGALGRVRIFQAQRTTPSDLLVMQARQWRRGLAGMVRMTAFAREGLAAQ